MGPRISVIVPLYKTEAYIEKCIRSLMAQTFLDFEILCVNDCSPDNSAEIIKNLSKEDSRIKLIEHEVNLGLGGARNTGLLAASSEYVASVDSDDYVEPDFLEALWAGADSGRYDVVVCGYKMVNPMGTKVGQGSQSVKILDPIPIEQNPIKISDPAFWNKLWRKSLFIDNNIFFPNHIYHQDSATTPRIYTKAKNIRFIGGSSYNYLIRSDSITQSTSDKHLLDRYRCVDVLKDFFIKEGLYEALQSDILERIYSGYSYHVGNVMKNRHGGNETTDNYLRHLLLMREAYIEYDQSVRAMSLEEKADYLLKHKPLPARGVHQMSYEITSKAAPLPRKNLPQNPKIMVLTLHSGENEFEDLCKSLDTQTHTNWDHRVFRGLGNQEGHKALYTCIMDNQKDFDLFVKVDADMMFSRPEVLRDIIQEFRDRPTLDHYIVACQDFMTGDDIIGVHTFSNRVNWVTSGQGIFNDPDPIRPGTRKIITSPKISYFHHASNPSSLQAFHFGAHRALKLVQRDFTLEQKRVAAIKTQWKVLTGLWTQYQRYGDRRHILALVGADLVISGSLGAGADDYHNDALTTSYEKYSVLTSRELASLVSHHWSSSDSVKRYHDTAVGPVGLQKLVESPQTA